MSQAARRWNGWGREGETFAVSVELSDWLAGRIGRGDPLGVVAEKEVAAAAPRSVPALPLPVAVDAPTRLRAARGMSFPDLVALRTGLVGDLPDGVVAPASASETVAVLRAAADLGVRVVIRGGGTSVVGGVTVTAAERPTVVLSTEGLSGLQALDRVSLQATFGGGTYGPALEEALSETGLRLGHEPQSFEWSTLGGWIAARSAGQRSTGVGTIERLLAGVEVATPAGIWVLAPQPASAAGPDLRQIVLGSEGRLGVITAATVRVRPRATAQDGVAILMPSWQSAVDVGRRLLQERVPVEVLRVSDPDETSMALSVLHAPAVARRLLSWLLSRRRFRSGCLMLVGWSGSGDEVARASRLTAELYRAAGGLGLGGSGWRSWLRDRFRHPYLRDALLSAGWGIDTLETAAPWSRLPQVYAAVRAAFAATAEGAATRMAVLCHLSHAYGDGASLYFTFLWPLRRGRETEEWLAAKRAATDAIVAAGATLSHHHGIGTMHAPWLAREVGTTGTGILAAAIRAADPAGVLSSGVLTGNEPC